MNDRIGKLIEQAEEWVCRDYPDAMDNSDEFHARTMEKFAQLIIRKCRDIVDKTRDNAIEDEWNVDEAMSTALFDIEDHFGMINIK